MIGHRGAVLVHLYPPDQSFPVHAKIPVADPFRLNHEKLCAVGLTMPLDVRRRHEGIASGKSRQQHQVLQAIEIKGPFGIALRAASPPAEFPFNLPPVLACLVFR